MPDFYSRERKRINLFNETRWRPPQLGALTAALSHWTLEPKEPALVSIPTGAGKTAIAMATPYVITKPPRRVLVIAPSSDLRTQLSDKFVSEHDLAVVSALAGKPDQQLKVMRMTTRIKSWSNLEEFDVVIALPNTISPRYYPGNLPPADLFDLVIIDEAHHASADTWHEILHHFKDAYSLLLTATPIRRDGKRIPGKLVYYYPMRLALEAGFYKPIVPRILTPTFPGDRDATDRQIAETCANIISQEEHSTSTLVVRANSIDRAESLTSLYKEMGIHLTPLHSRCGPRQREEIVNRLKDGSLRGAAVVGMLGEGFDLGSIRILAYHDKHKSLPATIQLFGRLARTDPNFPQSSILVTARDADIYPELQHIVRQLYTEDQDWARVLPRIIDDEIKEERENTNFALRFSGPSTEIHPAHLRPLLRSIILEIQDPAWEPFFLGDQIPSELLLGNSFNGGQIVYSQHDHESGIFILVVKHSGSPRWSSDPSVQNIEYQLHMLALKKAPTTDQNNLLFINTESQGAQTALLDLLELNNVARSIAPERIDDYVNSLERISVSAIGVRNTNPAGRGTVGYRNFMGSGVDAGLRAVDVNRAALGHGNVQVVFTDGTSINGGFAVEKAKIWMTRYLPLRHYAEWIEDAAARIWFPSIGPNGPLLPGIDRGRLFDKWPDTPPLVAEMDPKTFGRSYSILYNGKEYPVEIVDLHLKNTGNPLNEGEDLIIQARIPNHDGGNDDEIIIWEGQLQPTGNLIGNFSLEVRHGYASSIDFADLLLNNPPTIFFLDGTTIIGRLLYENTHSGPEFPKDSIKISDWIASGVDITAETRVTAAKRNPPAISIHEHLESFLRDRPKIGTNRWILQNDGSGEIADYIVIEPLVSGEIYMSLWHAKYSNGEKPSVRSTDFEVVVAQAIKSRRWFKRRNLWEEIGKRITGDAHPRAQIVEGSDDEELLKCHLGIADNGKANEVTMWTNTFPNVRGDICIAQPGLSKSRFIDEFESDAARSISQLLTTLSDTAQADALNIVVLGSVE